MGKSDYILAGGQKGLSRLNVLARTLDSESNVFIGAFDLSKVRKGLDLGCGTGTRSIDLATRIGAQGTITAIDQDPVAIRVAQKNAAKKKLRNIIFKNSSLEAFDPIEQFDLIYGRMILTHLRNPEKVLKKIRSWLKPGGIVIFEEPDLSSRVCFPKEKCVFRYTEIMCATARTKGLHPSLGPELLGLLKKVGFSKIIVRAWQPLYFSGNEKTIMRRTLQEAKSEILKNKACSKLELDQLMQDLKKIEKNPKILLGSALVFQYFARKS